jgi:putative transposase
MSSHAEAWNLSVAEINLLLFLDGVDVKSYSRATGKLRWALDAEDVCSMVELAFDLFRQWQPHSPMDAFNCTAQLLGVPMLVEADDDSRGHVHDYVHLGTGFSDFGGNRVKLVVQVKLLPDAAQASALQATLDLTNRAANLVAGVAWQRRVFGNYGLRKLVYGHLKTMGLSAQPAQQVVRKVADAYKLDRRTRRTFRADGAQPYDDRCLSWQPEQHTVSIWTTAGRLKGVQFACAAWQRDLLAQRKGESDLVHRDGEWYLYATCEVPEPTLNIPAGFLGVDLGIVNIATTSDGERYAGKHLNRVRHRNQCLRAKLQKKGTKSAKRLLRKRRRKEARFAADTNHVISKHIVAEAERTGRGIALEDLQGIRGRVRHRKPQRATLHSWSFHQLGSFIACKAKRAGVVVVQVDPAYTSQACSACGYVDRANRQDQATFCCRSCGFAGHADWNAARNIAERGGVGWAAVNQPHADRRAVA